VSLGEELLQILDRAIPFCVRLRVDLSSDFRVCRVSQDG